MHFTDQPVPVATVATVTVAPPVSVAMASRRHLRSTHARNESVQLLPQVSPLRLVSERLPTVQQRSLALCFYNIESIFARRVAATVVGPAAVRFGYNGTAGWAHLAPFVRVCPPPVTGSPESWVSFPRHDLTS
eukprot:2371666-Amphidinium_carterae.1